MSARALPSWTAVGWEIMSVRVFQVDAFAEEPFQGNPAAVCVLEDRADEAWMQAVAMEMNLSETAFIVPREELFELRWFTPGAEVDLCGHATLASAHVLWQTGRRASWPIQFETRSGVLTATTLGDRIGLDFPADPVQAADYPAGLGEVLGTEPVTFGAGKDYLFAEVANESILRSLQPDFGRLRQIVPVGICVSSLSEDPRFDFVSRFFAPGVGIDEDPVTGSAHCLLAPFWGDRLGKAELVGFQASRRGGVVRVRQAGDRTFLEGSAVTVMQGELLVEP
jgi:PhzF family phenazine biosynthesis protein